MQNDQHLADLWNRAQSEEQRHQLDRPHYVEDLQVTLGMEPEVEVDEEEEDGPVASVTDLAAFVANANAKFGGGDK